MNQAASATRRSPADLTAAAGCCPMFSAPFFGLATAGATATPQCVLNSQAQQLVQLARQQQPHRQSNSVLPPPSTHRAQQSTVSQQHHHQQHHHQHQPQQQQHHQTSMISRQLQTHQQQLQPQQPPAAAPAPPSTQGSQNYTSTDYNTSAPGLSLQHLLSSRHPASSCMALAAALASASFPHLQQQHQQQQQQPPALAQQQTNHQPSVAAPINQSTTTTTNTNNNINNEIVSSTVSPLTATTNSTTTPSNLTNHQVPLLNYNSYPSAQPPFINLPTLNVPQPSVAQQSQQAPPVAAHLNSTTNRQQTTNSIPNLLLNNLNPVAHSALSNVLVNHQRNGQQARPLVANTTLNSTAGQQQQPPVSAYRNTTHQPPVTNVQQQQQPSLATPAQQLGQVTRNILSDEALNSLFNDQFQAFLIYQLFSNHQFAPPSLANSNATQLQPQQVNSARPPPPPPTLPLSVVATSQGSAAVMTPSAQQIAPAQTMTQDTSEQMSENQQQAFNQATQPRAVPVSSTDPYTSSANNPMAGNLYPSHQRNEPIQQSTQSQQHRSQVDMSMQHPQQIQSQMTLPSPPPLQAQQQSQQQQATQQPQTNLPPIPFYPFPQMEQALNLLTNPQNTDNIFSQLYNMFLQSGLRTEQHHSHHNHGPHFHHHMHGAHHHHHGQDGQPSGQDATIPLDSMAINEPKPRGLNRAEIDSLTPYIHTNEKDARTCVICLSKFELKSKIRPLPCNHAFHAKCVDKWLKANRTCPICRRDALKTFNGKIKRI